MKFSAVGLCFLLASTILLAQSNPVPFLNQPLVPSAVAPGGSTFTLTVNGTGFVPGSTVNWSGAGLATNFVSSSQLTARVPATNIASTSTAWITVSNPTPGGGTSSVLFLPISNPTGLQFTSFPEGVALQAPVLADYNGDGNLDFAAPSCMGSFGSCSFSMFLGNGDGSFQSPGGLWGFLFFSAGDLNGDGKPDLVGATCNTVACNASTLIGNGDGTFSSGIGVAIPVAWFSPLKLADVNGDGKLDVLASGNDIGGPEFETIYTCLGNGDGTTQSCIASDVNVSSGVKLVGDFNGDGKLDLIANDYATQIVFIQGNGDGTFQPPSTPYVLGVNTRDVVAADINADGILDLITVQTAPANTYTVLLGNGDGTFSAQAPVPVGGAIGTGTTISDMNADGTLDLVLAADSTNNSQTIFIVPGNGDGTFQNAVQVASNANYTSAGDFNNDGQMDLATNVGVLIQGSNFGIALASGSSSSQTIKAGQSATFGLSITPLAGLSGTVNLTCAVTPMVSAAPTCSLSPSSFQISGTSAQSVTVTVGTTAATTGGTWPNTALPRTIGLVLWTATPLGLMGLWIRNRKRLTRFALIAMMFALSLCVACSGGSSPPPTQGTPAGTYTATVTGTSGSLNHTTTLTVVVQ